MNIVLPCEAGFSGLQKQNASGKVVPSSIQSLALGWGNSPFTLPLPIYFLLKHKLTAGQEREGKKKGREGRRGEETGKDNCDQSWSLNSTDPFLNMNVLRGTKFRAETHAKHIVGISAFL